MANTPNFPATPKAEIQDFIDTDTTTKKDIVSNGGATIPAGGVAVRAIYVTNTTNAAVTMELFAIYGGTTAKIAEFNVPKYAGHSDTGEPVATYDLFQDLGIFGSSVDQNGRMEFLVSEGGKLQVAMKTAVAASEKVTVMSNYFLY